MYLQPEINYQVKRLFTALEYGERLAHDCAHRQACLIKDKGMRRFLLMQSRHEAFHAKFFRHASSYLGTNHTGKVPASLTLFGNKISAALDRKDIVESIVAQQIVLEAFGGAILERLNVGLDNKGVGLRKLRRMLLQQEKSHQAFGDEILRQQLTAGSTTIETLQTFSREYLQIAENIIIEMSDVFICLDEDPDDYKQDIYNDLPDWLEVRAK